MKRAQASTWHFTEVVHEDNHLALKLGEKQVRRVQAHTLDVPTSHPVCNVEESAQTSQAKSTERV